MDELVLEWISVLESQGYDLHPLGPSLIEKGTYSSLTSGIPNDLARFYEISGWTDSLAPEEESSIAIWARHELIPVRREWPEAPEHLEEYVVFADQGLRAWDYAIRFGAPPHPVVILDGAVPPTRVAQSFREFLEKLLNEPRSLMSARCITSK